MAPSLIAVALMAASLLETAPARADEVARFRYRAELQRCTNDRGETGLNVPVAFERDHECADYRGKVVMYLNAKGGNFRGADFDGTKFMYLNGLRRADLTGARLTRIEGSMLDLAGADLSAADLTGARLRPCGSASTGTCLVGARFDAKTKLPFPRDEALARGMVPIDTP